jgi:hypothetical protein
MDKLTPQQAIEKIRWLAWSQDAFVKPGASQWHAVVNALEPLTRGVDLGVWVAVTDFGTGVCLKQGKSELGELFQSETSDAVLTSAGVIQLGKSYRVTVVVEEVDGV